MNALFPFIRFDDKERKVVVIDWAEKETGGLSFRHDTWAYNLARAIPFNAVDMRMAPDKEVRPAIYYKNRKQLEKNINSKFPLAIWYNGMLEACNNPDTILQSLV